MAIAVPLRRTFRQEILDVLQIGSGVALVLALLFAPPSQGQIALYPMTLAAKHDLLAIATDAERRIISRTGFADGLVIQGTRPAFKDLLIDHGILALAIPESGCTGEVT